MNGEVKSATPLHLVSATEKRDSKDNGNPNTAAHRLTVTALSHRPVGLMSPGGPGELCGATVAPVAAVGESKSKSKPDGKGGDNQASRPGLRAGQAGHGGAGSLCTMQVWECVLVFEKAQSCNLAREHIERRRAAIQGEKVGAIMALLKAC
ncbi:unnamed protein product [Discosporangium mesarthrocarpum]